MAKISRQARPVPQDFEVIFVEKGRLECETWYRARRTTITRWLEECGKDRLIDRRASYVRSLRRQGKWITRSTDMVDRRVPRKTVAQRIKDERRARPQMARLAAEHLRKSDKWVIVRVSNNEWIVGTRRRSSAEVIEMAERKGFDQKAAWAERMNLQQSNPNAVKDGG